MELFAARCSPRDGVEAQDKYACKTPQLTSTIGDQAFQQVTSQGCSTAWNKGQTDEDDDSDLGNLSKPFPGVLHFKRLFSDTEQTALYSSCHQMTLASKSKYVRQKLQQLSSRAKVFQGTGQNHLPVSLGSHEKGATGGASKIEEVIDVAKKIIATKSSAASVLHGYDPIAFNCLLYPSQGVLASHLDSAIGYRLLISIGDAVDFVFGRPVEETEQAHTSVETHLRLESGDALLFRGESTFHGVDGLFPGTAPAFWTNGDIQSYGMSRMVLIFRDNVWEPSPTIFSQ